MEIYFSHTGRRAASAMSLASCVWTAIGFNKLSMSYVDGDQVRTAWKQEDRTSFCLRW